VLSVLAFGAKALFLGSALLAIGLALHRLLGIAPRTPLRTRVLAGAACLAAGATVARLALANAQLSGTLAGAFSGEMFAFVWATNGFHALAVWAGAGLTLIGLALRDRTILAAGAASLALSFALTGHTRGLENPGLWPWILGGHALLAGFWLAAPIGLWPVSDLSDRAVQRATDRFSRLAVWIVPALFVGGGLLFWRLAGAPWIAWETSYGQLLSAKILFALGALSVGAYTKLRISDRLRRDPAGGRRMLRMTLSTEAALFLGVLATLAAATTLTGPAL
jgi:putative copper export protein